MSFANVLVHIVFSTKNRDPFLLNPEFRTRTHAYLGSVAKTLKCHPIKIGGIADNVHLLISLARTITIADFVKEVKRVSTDWIRNNGQATFRWQAEYAAFSVDQSNVQEVVAYIRRQEDHHHTVGFQDEYRRLLREHTVDFDEIYMGVIYLIIDFDFGRTKRLWGVHNFGYDIYSRG